MIMLKFICIFFFISICYADDKPIIVGNPFLAEYKNGEMSYARNIWDITEYKGLLFFGAGNANNTGPAINAGPVSIISYNPSNNQFKNEGYVDDEQINRFIEINQELYIPGFDAMQSWKYGNFYQRKQQGRWEKHRTIPGAMHVYDLIGYDNKLFAAIWINKQSAIAISSDNGKIWNIQPLNKKGLVERLFLFDESLFALEGFRLHGKYHVNFLKYQNEKFSVHNTLSFKELFPETKNKKAKISLLIVKSVGKSLCYIPVFFDNRKKSVPIGMYCAFYDKDKNMVVQKLKIDEQCRPRDMLVRKNKVYVLATCSVGKLVNNKVFMLDEKINNQQEILGFKSNTFARSFEYLEGYFYFGLGTDVKDRKNWDINELSDWAGIILKVRDSGYFKN